MYFTREPIVETVITSKEGYKLTLRNSKGGQEEYCVDAVEVIAFGNHCFFRSLEKSKSFLLPVSDYEVLETRETKVMLKAPTIEKNIKIGGGREMALRPIKEMKEEETPVAHKESHKEPHKEIEHPKETPHHAQESKNDRKKERRRFRKRKEDQQTEGDATAPLATNQREEKISLIPPPTTLISETISRYKDLPDYAGAFFAREDKENGNHHHKQESQEVIVLPEPNIEHLNSIDNEELPLDSEN